MDKIDNWQNKIKFAKILIYLVLGCFGYIFVSMILDYNGSIMSETKMEKKKFSNISKLEDNINFNIKNSLFKGEIDTDSRYQLKAQIATKTEHDKYMFEIVEGVYESGQSPVQMRSTNGTIDNKTNIIMLYNDVVLNFDDIHLELQKIKFDTITKCFESDTGVSVLFNNNSTIKAKSIKSENGVDRIKFKGGVESCFDIKSF